MARPVPVGATGMSDFTIHKDPARKERYTHRHKKNEHWDDPTTAGCYVKNILWNGSTVKQSVNDLNTDMRILILL